MFVASTVEYIKTGKVRALAVTTPTRSEVLPDVPPLSEFVPGYDAAAWIGVGAPKNTPPEIIDKLNKAVNAALADPKLKLRLADLGSSVAGGSAAEHTSPLSGMIPMYLLMSAFHSPPWLELISSRRNGARRA